MKQLIFAVTTKPRVLRFNTIDGYKLKYIKRPQYIVLRYTSEKEVYAFMCTDKVVQLIKSCNGKQERASFEDFAKFCVAIT